MASVRIDLIKDSKATINETTVSIVRSFVVEGLAGPAAYRMLEAIAATGVIYGQSHPNSPLLLAKDFESVSMSDTVASVLVTYSLLQFQGGGQVVAEYQGSLRSELIDEDITLPGQPIKVMWWAKDVEKGVIGKQHGAQGAVINIDRNIGNLLITKYVILPSDDTSTFTTLEDAYLGHCNATTWRGREKYKWRCDSFNAQRLGTRTYKLNMTFAYHPKTWYSWARYVDPFTGRPPANAKKNELFPDISNGWKRISGYALADFDNIYTAFGAF